MKNFNLAKKMLALALGVLMLLSVMTGCSKTNDQAGGGSGDTQQEQTGALLKKIKDSGKLVVGTEAQYAPMSSRTWTLTSLAAICGWHSRLPTAWAFSWR